jgi:hypothetical protein
LRPASRSRLLKRCRANNVRGVQRCGMPPLPPRVFWICSLHRT